MRKLLLGLTLTAMIAVTATGVVADDTDGIRLAPERPDLGRPGLQGSGLQGPGLLGPILQGPILERWGAVDFRRVSPGAATGPDFALAKAASTEAAPRTVGFGRFDAAASPLSRHLTLLPQDPPITTTGRRNSTG